MLRDLLVRMSRSQKAAIIIAIDAFLVIAAFVGGNAMLTGSFPTVAILQASAPFLLTMVPAAIAVILYFDLHRMKLNSYELKGVIQTALMASVSGAVGMMTSVFIGAGISPQFFVIFSMILLIASASARLVLREIVIRIYRQGKG